MSFPLGLRRFSLGAERAVDGVYFGTEGVFVGNIPLLDGSAGETSWSVRPIADLNEELSVRYRLPIDVGAKANALALIARALNRGDFATGAIATVQMQFPRPPLAKAVETEDEIIARAFQLHRSGLLKGEWDPSKHPRRGAPPNRAWFAPVPKESKLPTTTATGPKIPKGGWPQPHVNRIARLAVKIAIKVATRYGGRLLILGLELNPWIDAFLATFTPIELNRGEDRLTAQLKAALQPYPKTLEELRQMPTEDLLGYEQHHIVEQNPQNLAKIIIEKFGRERLDASENLVWLPRFLHEEVTTYYSENLIGPGGPTVRQFANVLSFEQQRALGLGVLRKYQVLK